MRTSQAEARASQASAIVQAFKRGWIWATAGEEEGNAMSRIVCRFSCGAASAVATKLTLSRAATEEILIVNAFIVEEHADNRRFAEDCERWFGHPILVLRDERYGASTKEVWRRKQYIKGQFGAPCSLELKRRLLNSISRPGDIAVIGYTNEERDRYDDLCEHFPEVKWDAPLIREGLSHDDCLTIIHDAGIALPEMYRLGYRNANCIGCPKGGQGYWQAIRCDFPSEFAAIMALQESIGQGAYFLQFRSGPRKGERMGLKDLPDGPGDRSGPMLSCSFQCDLIEREIGVR